MFHPVKKTFPSKTLNQAKRGRDKRLKNPNKKSDFDEIVEKLVKMGNVAVAIE